MLPINAWGQFFVEPHQPLQKREFTISECSDDEVVVAVAGCGLCHTDLGFINGSVNTRQELPLILGHEISGQVVAYGANAAHLAHKKVIIPAVLPCGECELCEAGRDNICQSQRMPGNDFNGGFASHIKVPARFLCVLPEDLGEFQLAHLSVVADAITTPYQSLKRSGLQAGDLAIVIGTGGVGLYMVQHAKNAGATVIAIELDEERLRNALNQGADYGNCTKVLEEKAIKAQVKSLVKEHQLPKHQWKVFENSGSTAGQSLAFSLLSFAGTLGIVGFTMDKLSLRLSNVMAFDADIFGNWGCRPAYYRAVADDVLNKKINLLDNVEFYPLSEMNAVVERALAHQLKKRAILIPN